MGCTTSKQFVVNNNIPGQDSVSYQQLFLLGLTKDEINKLYRVFCKFDMIGDGEIEIAEFTAKLNIGISKITREIFADMDTNHDGGVNFKEFVFSMYHYLVKSKQAIAEFAFDIFDTDNSGSLSKEEIKEMVTYVYGGAGLEGHLHKIIETMDTSHDGKIGRREFIDAASGKFPALLFPAFEMQLKLQEAILGQRFWERKSKQSQEIMSHPEVKELYHQRSIRMKNKKKAGTTSTSTANIATTTTTTTQQGGHTHSSSTTHHHTKQNHTNEKGITTTNHSNQNSTTTNSNKHNSTLSKVRNTLTIMTSKKNIHAPVAPSDT